MADTTVAPVQLPQVGACDRYASSDGSDAAGGTAQAPVRTAQRLVSILRPGQVGCLAAGEVFEESIRVDGAGTRRQPIVLTSAPGGARATLRGRVVVTNTAHDVVFDDLLLDASTAGEVTSPYVYGQRITFTNNDVSNGHAGRSCFLVGSNSHVAHDITIYGNRIHDCGRMPATNLDHGIYALASRDLVISHNYIYDNADWGVHLFPDARRTVVDRNIIDRNGSGLIFAGDDDVASSRNSVTNNIITDSLIKHDVEAFWSGPVGGGNVVNNNCVHGGQQGAFNGVDGYERFDNVTADPGYADPDAGDYTLPEDSLCAVFGPDP
ncbi:MAG: right-handed parallel beta-helix repeat-containing protein, partial [Miltoncostaeaceae bacterium]